MFQKLYVFFFLQNYYRIYEICYLLLLKESLLVGKYVMIDWNDLKKIFFLKYNNILLIIQVGDFFYL